MRQAGIQNVYYVTADPDALQAFYAQALGLDTRFADKGKWVQFAAAGRNFALASPQEGGGAAPGSACVVFEVDDLDGFARSVEEHGGTTGARRDMGSHGRIVSCPDPAGNVFQLFARSRPAEAQR